MDACDHAIVCTCLALSPEYNSIKLTISSCMVIYNDGINSIEIVFCFNHADHE